MPKLTTDRRVYDPVALEGWVQRRRHAIRLPAASLPFLRLLQRKRRSRTNRTPRFFGEVFVASQTPHQEAHYSSVKWLTNRNFAGARRLANPDHERLRKALHRDFGAARVAKLQDVVRDVAHRCKKELRGKLPTAPDLWLACRGKRHRFIEVKLPGDFVAPHQLAGMAAIASVFGRDADVSVEIVELNDEQRLFKIFSRAAG